MGFGSEQRGEVFCPFGVTDLGEGRLRASQLQVHLGEPVMLLRQEAGASTGPGEREGLSKEVILELGPEGRREVKSIKMEGKAWCRVEDTAPPAKALWSEGARCL